MPANRLLHGFKLHRNLASQELPCSWCGTPVPLPAGDFSGVCIDCGTVMFRPSMRRAVSAEPREQGLPA